FLLDGLRKGAVGCITASGNVNVPGIRKVYENWQTPQADQLQAEITTVRKAIQAYPMVPALKRIVAHFHNDPDWAAVRSPMVPLDRKSTRLNSSHRTISYAVSCLKTNRTACPTFGRVLTSGPRALPTRRCT